MPIADSGNQGGIRMWPSEYWASKLYDLANWGLIVGLIIGVISTILLVWMGNIKEVYLRKDLAATNERAAKAETTAEGFRLDIALANQRAAEANQNAEAERLARVKLEQKLADRTLTDEQVKAIAEALRPFSGQEYEITPYWDSKESVSIANRIGNTLQMGCWKYLSSRSNEAILGGAVGILVVIHPEADERTKKAAASLISALLKEGIGAEEQQENVAG